MKKRSEHRSLLVLAFWASLGFACQDAGKEEQARAIESDEDIALVTSTEVAEPCEDPSEPDPNPLPVPVPVPTEPNAAAESELAAENEAKATRLAAVMEVFTETTCGPCAGSTVDWKYGTKPVDVRGNRRYPGTATSAVSNDDCFKMLDGYAETFCQEQGIPTDCAGTCTSTSASCKKYGESTDKVRVPNPAPNKFSCKATKGKCGCKCR